VRSSASVLRERMRWVCFRVSSWVRRWERWVWRDIVDVDWEGVVVRMGLQDVGSEVVGRRGVDVEMEECVSEGRVVGW